MNDEPQLSRAVALRYEGASALAPRVVASGRGAVAEKILETARAAGVHISTDPALLELLARVPIGSEIPTELYQAVAEVLAFVYRLERESRSR